MLYMKLKLILAEMEVIRYIPKLDHPAKGQKQYNLTKVYSHVDQMDVPPKKY